MAKLLIEIPYAIMWIASQPSFMLSFYSGLQKKHLQDFYFYLGPLVGCYQFNFIWQLIVFLVTHDTSFDNLFNLIDSSLDLPISIDELVLAISLSTSLYFLVLHWFLKEYEREDHDFFIGDARKGQVARIESVVWDLGAEADMEEQLRQ